MNSKTSNGPRQWNLLDRLILAIALRFGAKSKEVERFLKFAVVGTIGAVVDFGVLNLLQTTVLPPSGIHETMHVRLATGLAFTTAVTSNFIWNRYWTYPDSRSRRLALQLVQFFVVNVVGLLFRLAFVGALYGPLGDAAHSAFGLGLTSKEINQVGVNIAQGISMVFVMFWNFFVNRYWTYNDVDKVATPNAELAAD